MDGGWIFVIGFLMVALLSWFIWDKRYHRNVDRDAPQGYLKTEEVFIDPVDGKKQRVYYNPENGDRCYISEK